jgi:hypothetical protein
MVEDPITIDEGYRDESHSDWPRSAGLDKYKAKLGRNVLEEVCFVVQAIP